MPFILNAQSILDDPCASYWLKDALRKLMSRDPVDVLNDAETLYKLSELRLAEIAEFEAATQGKNTFGYVKKQ